MADGCENCGAELFAGQQFCRRCGAPVRPHGDESPTQLLGPGGPDAGASTTTRLSGPPTDPVFPPRQTAHPARFAQAPYAPPPAATVSFSRRGLLLTVVLGLLAVCGAGALLVARLTRDVPRVVFKKGVPPAPVDVAVPHRPHQPHRPLTAGHEHDESVLEPLGEEGAVARGGETLIGREFDLEEDAVFVIRNTKGRVSVEGWDEPRAEVKITKRGGSDEQRRGAQVLHAHGDGRLSLVTAAADPVEVSYEVRLPRALRQVSVSAENSEVRLADLRGTVLVDVKAGSVELRDVTGVTRSKIIKGNTKVSFETAANGGAQEFTAVRGNVEVDFARGTNGDVKAETMDGHIGADKELGLRVVEAPAGRHLVGRLGRGGDPLLIKVVNGDIRLRK